MLWDTCMPANLGYLQAFLYNQNNVALEASPVTSKLEVEVGRQLCEMIYGKFLKYYENLIFINNFRFSVSFVYIIGELC